MDSWHGQLTRVLREADGECGSEDLLFEQIFLVEEKDDGCVTEPLVVADRVKQFQTLLHPVGRFVLMQHLNHTKVHNTSNKLFHRWARIHMNHINST